MKEVVGMGTTGVLFLISVLLIWLGFRQIKLNRIRLAEGVVTKARVIDMKKHIDVKNRVSYIPVVQFITENGETITVDLQNTADCAVGDDIEVVYLRNKPSEVISTTWFPNYGVPMIMMVLGVVVMLVSIYQLLH